MTTIYDALAERLGRKPTHEETKAEVRRIIGETNYSRLQGAAWRNVPATRAALAAALRAAQVRS